MDFWRWILGASLMGAIFLLDYLYENTKKLKEERKENYNLKDENYNLKKKIDDLKEDNKFLKETVMEFKGGELTKGELIKQVQLLIDKDKKEIERKRLERLQKKIKISEIFDIDLKEKD